MHAAGVVVDEVEVLPSDPPQRPTSVPQALQQNMPLASVGCCTAFEPFNVAAVHSALVQSCKAFKPSHVTALNSTKLVPAEHASCLGEQLHRG